MNKREIILCLIAIVILTILIVDKVENDKIIDRLSTEQTQLYQKATNNEVLISDLDSEKAILIAKLNEWDEIDIEWLYWIEDNWELLETIGAANGR